MLRNKLSSSSVSSHMDLSMFKSVIMPDGNNENSIVTPTKKLFSTIFSRKSKESSEIKQAGFLSSRLERPFRFTPQIEFSNNSFAAFMDLQNDERVYSLELKRAIHHLRPFYHHDQPVIESLVEALEQLRSVTANLEITDSVDMSIISRVPSIERTYLEYLRIYTQLSLYKKTDSVDSKLAFLLEGLEATLLTPFQRILEYRFFLRKVFKCEQHLCNERGCRTKNCPTKQRMNAANKEATVFLSQIIKKCYSYFNMVDNFPGLVEWEEKLNTKKCESIGQGDSKMKVDLYLTAPYKLPHQQMAELPQIFFSESFESIPITQDLKLFVRQRKERHRVIVRLNLFSDFILITVDDGVDNMLLFPPMPLSHISLESHLERGTDSVMITLKLSPFKMLLLEPCLQSSGEKLLQVFANLAGFPRQTGEPSSKLPLNEIIVETKTSSDRFKTICRPFIWKPSSDKLSEFEWSRLSKCDLVVKSIGSSRVILLIAEGTERSLLNAKISPITIYSQVSAKRLQLTVTDKDGIRKKFIIQVSSEAVLTELMEELESSIQSSLKDLVEKNKDQLVIDELPFWIGVSDQNPCLQVKELGLHSGIMIQNSCGNWIPFGAAQTFVVLAGSKNECNYYRLYLQSTINSSISFLELDMGTTRSWSNGMQGSDLILRVFRVDNIFTDYYFDLKTCPDFASELKLLGQEAHFIQEKITEEEKRLAELKKIEEDLLQLAVSGLKEETVIALDGYTSTGIEEAGSSVSLVDTIAADCLDQQGNNCKSDEPAIIDGLMMEGDSHVLLKVSESSASLGNPNPTESEPKHASNKYFDPELYSLVRELRTRERETTRMYEQFCRLHDEKRRLLKRIK